MRGPSPGCRAERSDLRPERLGRRDFHQMKNGFNYQGSEAELRGGSFRSPRAVTMQSGAAIRQRCGLCGGFDALNDDGWRDQSQSKLRRVFADIGA